MRSAGSKTPFDLIAVPTFDNVGFPSEVLLIQCKHGAKIGKVERDRLQDEQQNMIAEVQCIVAWSKANGKIEFYKWHSYPLIGYTETPNYKYTWSEMSI